MGLVAVVCPGKDNTIRHGHTLINALTFVVASGHLHVDLDNGVWGESVSALEVGKRFDSPPGFQVTGHTHRRAHLQAVVHPGFRSAATAQRRVLGLDTHMDKSHCKSISKCWNVQRWYMHDVPKCSCDGTIHRWSRLINVNLNLAAKYRGI